MQFVIKRVTLGPDYRLRDGCLLAQGYRMSRLPFKLTWSWIDKNDGTVSELRIRSDDYNLDLYRRKGYVLDRKFLDPQA